MVKMQQKVWISVVLCIAAAGGLNALIIPDEVPTLLSLIYSNIPTLMKGTDSRLGWGFRLGDRADFQVLVELGPQKNTQPLANQDTSNGSSNKRDVANNLANKLYAQRQKEKNQISESEGGKFIEQWSQTVSQANVEAPRASSSVPLGVGEVDAHEAIPNDSILKLEELYGKSAPKPTTQKPKTTTSYKDALDNVDLE